MKHVVVDLEMNKIQQKSEARRICTQETIEIGAVMLDDKLQEVASFRTYVKPEYNDGMEKDTVLPGWTIFDFCDARLADVIIRSNKK